MFRRLLVCASFAFVLLVAVLDCRGVVPGSGTGAAITAQNNGIISKYSVSFSIFPVAMAMAIDPDAEPHSPEPMDDIAALDSDDSDSTEQETFLLDAPQEGSEAAEGVTKLVLGEKVSLDALGPMIINKDGTVSRITNWDVKLPHEREAISRVIARRNKDRIKLLDIEGELELQSSEL
jgi:hypothetical protein